MAEKRKRQGKEPGKEWTKRSKLGAAKPFLAVKAATKGRVSNIKAFLDMVAGILHYFYQLNIL